MVKTFGMLSAVLALTASVAFGATADLRNPQAFDDVVRFGAAGDRKNLQVFNDVAKSVNRYAHFTIFDDVEAKVVDGVVTLTGRVTMPYKRDDIMKRVAAVDGVREVRDNIHVLPVSQSDDRLRYQIARAIYGNPNFWNYAI